MFMEITDRHGAFYGRAWFPSDWMQLCMLKMVQHCRLFSDIKNVKYTVKEDFAILFPRILSMKVAILVKEGK